MPTQHHFTLTISPEWSVDDGAVSGRKLRRRHRVDAPGKTMVAGSAAVAFHGEANRWNPEELFVASLAQCHMLSLLYVVDRDQLELIHYSCTAEGTLEIDDEGFGRVTRVTIAPRCEVAVGQGAALQAAHHEAHELCFIARSVSCEVLVKPETREVSPPVTQL